ncbi:MAG TPA: metal-dependent hydrolase [Candidatus Udaeobacter sp.]|nr:metal-dependent hydrolase [Candidatus Udaeobacter sp.]
MGALALMGLVRRLGLVRRRTPAPAPVRLLLDFRSQFALYVWAALLVFAANAPDLDFVPGILLGEPDRFHHGPAHSLGGAIIFAGLAWLVARALRRRQALPIAALMGAGFMSHLFLDMCSLDTRAPNGVPLFWPFSSAYIMLPLPVFMDIQRNTAASNFFTSLLSRHNLQAISWEFVVMGLVLAIQRACSLVITGLRERGAPAELPADAPSASKR